ncbi:MAG TPA: hypothetical protein VFG83_04320 [Kofleriaceae bacterium]|nr:hypothetical protein [Kofleriaceae bacterium]
MMISIALMVLGAGVARAGAPVVEAHAGDRTSDVDYLLSPFFDELAKRGYSTPKNGLATKIEAAVSQTGDSLPESEIKGATLLLDRGYQAWITGNFDQAVELTQNGLDLLLSRPATIARRQSLRDKTFRGYAVLGLANKRQGDMRNANAAMAQLLRAFPDREYSRKQFGPEGHNLYLQVKAELDKEPKGGLTVTVDDPSTVVFINGRYVAIGGAKLGNLYPGPYRVYVQKGDMPGRVHEVEVKGGESATLTIHWQLDRALRSRDMVGLSFSDGDDLAALSPALGAKMATLLGANQIVVVGIRPHGHSDAMVASVIDARTATVVRSAALAIVPSPPAEAAIAALAAFIDGEPPTSGIQVIATGGTAPAVADTGASFGSKKIIALGVGGAGVAAIVAGGVFFAINGNCQDVDCETVYQTAPLGIGLSVAGAAAVGAGVYLWLTADDGDAPPATAVAVGPGPQHGWFVTYGRTF